MKAFRLKQDSIIDKFFFTGFIVFNYVTQNTVYIKIITTISINPIKIEIFLQIKKYQYTGVMYPFQYFFSRVTNNIHMEHKNAYDIQKL